MKPAKSKTAADLMKAYESIDVPFNVWRLFHSTKKNLDLSGDLVSLGDGDYATLNEAREALKWYVEQFNGQVIWQDDDPEFPPPEELDSEQPTSRRQFIVNDYKSGISPQTIAQGLNVTTERIRQILWKVHRESNK